MVAKKIIILMEIVSIYIYHTYNLVQWRVDGEVDRRTGSEWESLGEPEFIKMGRAKRLTMSITPDPDERTRIEKISQKCLQTLI